jgi:uncharacterized protein YaaN involved in tellurite resistance
MDMNNVSTQFKDGSKAIVTAQHYSQEMQTIKKSPALPPMSEFDLRRADEMSKALIRSEDRLDDIVVFGSEAQATLANITKDMLRGVRVGSLDEVIQLSEGVLAQIHTLDINDLSPQARKLLLGISESARTIKNRIENFFRRYEMVNSRLDRQEADIFAKETASTERYYKDAELAKAGLGILLDAQLRRMAIKIFLDGEYGYAELQHRQRLVVEESEAASRENRSLDYAIIAAADRYAKYIERLEGKAAALQQVILSAYQMSVTIHMMGDNENIIRQKLSDIRTELLPQWRTLIAIAYQAYQQQGIAQFVEQLSRSEAELRRQVGDQIEETATGVAGLMTRPIMDYEAMRYCNEKLITSLDILKTASIEAKKIRDSAEGEMQGLVKQLGDAVAETTMRTE